MPPLIYDDSEYMIPRGIAFFDPLLADGTNEGEDDMGNTPSVTLTITTEKADHFGSRKGIREKDFTTLVQIDRTGVLTCDNLSAANAVRWFSGEKVTQSQTADPVVDAEIAVIPGRFYQLGKTSANPAGHRNIAALVVTDGAEVDPETFIAGTDYAVDLVSGRLQILSTGAIVAGNISVSYTKGAKTWTQIKTGNDTELAGSLRIIADNATGTNRDYYMPSVKLKPRGDWPVITSDTQYITMEFDLEVLTPANGSAIYLDDQPVAA
jgi:hypothetical protein